MSRKVYALMLAFVAALAVVSIFTTQDKKERVTTAGAMGLGKEIDGKMERFTQHTTVGEVATAPAFNGMGRLLFPLDRPIDVKVSLSEVGNHFLWYEGIKPERTVAVMNYFKT